MDWFDLLAVQGALKSLFQHHSSKASLLRRSGVLLSSSHICAWRLEKHSFDLCGALPATWRLWLRAPSRFVMFLPRSRCHLISRPQSPPTVNLSKKIKSVTASTFSTYICYEMMGPDAMILVFWMLSLKPAFALSSFMLIKRLFSSSSLSAIRRAKGRNKIHIHRSWMDQLKVVSMYNGTSFHL